MDAELLRRCCHRLGDQIDPRGLRLHGAAIVGSLDLAGLEVPFPVRFDDCEFDSPLIVEGAQLQELALLRCSRLPGLLANGLRVHRDLDLSGSHVTGAHRTTASTSKRAAVWLCESDIGGRLLCVDTTILTDGERSIQADRMHVAGTVRFLHQFSAHGDMRLLGVRIDGSLDFTGAHLFSPAGQALDLNNAVIGGSLFLIADTTTGRRPTINGRIDLSSARISGQFLIRNATLSEAASTPTDSGYAHSRAHGTALSAPRLSVGAEVTFDGACQLSGGIDMSMSELSSLSIEPGCSLRAPGRTALDLTNAELLSTLAIGEKVPVEGTVRLTGTRIHGNLRLRGAILTEPEHRSLIAASGIVVDGEVELQHLEATGGRLGFRSAAIGSVINAAGAQLNNPGRFTLYLVQANVKGAVRLTDDFKSTGTISLNAATIEGRLTCEGGSFDCPDANRPDAPIHAIEAISATIRGGMHLGWKFLTPSVNFTNTRTSFLADDPMKWPSRFVIAGFTYDRFEKLQGSSSGATWDARSRREWLSRQTAYDAGPYEQTARVFRQHGYANRAEEILIAQRRMARRTFTGHGALLRWARDAAYSATVGYGYRPGRVALALVVLLILVAASLDVPTARASMRATTSAGVVYTTRGPTQVTTTTRVKPPGTAVHVTAPDACGNGEVRCLNPVLYAIDTVIPLISLDQRSTWYPDPHVRGGTFMEWWLDIATLLGWLLSSILVLSFARLARTT